MKSNERYFYRVENKKGHGPYSMNRRSRRKWMIGFHGDGEDSYHPSLSAELGLRALTEIKGCHIFGFVSLTQLQRWFCVKELEELDKLGYKIRRVLGEEVFTTPTQSVFIPKRRLP